MKSLVVEDDFFSRCILQTFLSGYGECHVAVDGKEAIFAYEQSLSNKSPYDVICLDIMMPEMDGQEVLKKIRDIEERMDISGRSSVKIFMTTALDDSESIRTALSEKCDAYLFKPIDQDNLKNILIDYNILA